MIELLRKKEILIFVGIAILFFMLRLSAVNHLYHQDEYKWPGYANRAVMEAGGVPHPPIGEFIYTQLGSRIGFDNFRVIPLIFSFANLFLIFYLSKTVFDTKTGLWTAFLFAVSLYSILASLTVDTDGSIMPFFLLIAAIAYFKIKKTHPPAPSQREGGESQKISLFWISVLILSIILGFLTKTSFIIAIGALVIDFAIEKGIFSDKKRFFRYLGYGLGLGIVLILVLLISKIIFPFFNLQSSVLYWEHFFKLSGRGWLQTFIQFAKSLLYTSPLIIFPVFLANREIFKKTRLFFIFIALGLFFYLFLFDFSTGALDRYFQFLVVPLCIISGSVFAELKIKDLKLKDYMLPILISLFIFSFSFFIHFVPPLHPKTEWLHRVVSFEWNFLFPFTGGSGPTGFYISFLFIALIWGVSFLATQKKYLFAVLVLGLTYNFVFVEEYLFGRINGSPYRLFAEAREFIVENDDIKSVVVYNDIGGYEIQKTGKYERRLYASPAFEETYEDFFGEWNGHVLYIDIPRIGEGNFYSSYLSLCKNVYEKRDGYITAKILRCGK